MTLAIVKSENFFVGFGLFWCFWCFAFLLSVTFMRDKKLISNQLKFETKKIFENTCNVTYFQKTVWYSIVFSQLSSHHDVTFKCFLKEKSGRKWCSEKQQQKTHSITQLQSSVMSCRSKYNQRKFSSGFCFHIALWQLFSNNKIYLQHIFSFVVVVVVFPFLSLTIEIIFGEIISWPICWYSKREIVIRCR